MHQCSDKSTFFLLYSTQKEAAAWVDHHVVCLSGMSEQSLLHTRSKRAARTILPKRYPVPRLCCLLLILTVQAWSFFWLFYCLLLCQTKINKDTHLLVVSRLSLCFLAVGCLEDNPVFTWSPQSRCSVSTTESEYKQQQCQPLKLHQLLWLHHETLHNVGKHNDNCYSFIISLLSLKATDDNNLQLSVRKCWCRTQNARNQTLIYIESN